MKKIATIVGVFLMLMTVSALAQAPQAIKYQAVTRDVNGNILANQQIKMRIGILFNSTGGDAIYTETHTVVTNAYGLVNLEIGYGSVLSGNFAFIDWSKGNYYVKIEADETGGDNFQLLGTSQLLSVPFAMYANSSGIKNMTENQRDSLINPSEGMMIYNVNSQCLNVRRQGNWFELCGDCVPQPSLPLAGQDAYSPVDTMIQLSANTPSKGTGTWVVLSGTGGYFSNIHAPDAIFHGQANQNYKLGWQISTNCKTLVDTINVSLTQVIITGFSCGDSILHGGRYYHTIEIGSQCWMKENMDIGVMVNGNVDQSDNSIIEKYCYNDNPANCAVYGGLYQWNEMMQYANTAGSPGICPTGTHVPSNSDWDALIAFNGGVMAAGGALKETGLLHWADPNNGATNSSGFTAFGAGYRHVNGFFFNQATNVCYWGSNVNTIDNGSYYFLRNVDGGITQNYFGKSYGFTVRCIVD